jgi:hypothetical protein
MAEATDSVHLTHLRASMSLATMTLARQAAMKAAKHRLQAQGLQPSQFSHRELIPILSKADSLGIPKSPAT